jgi:hypothetical protein
VAVVQRGCLLLADLSGYTRYLTGVELEHSHDVLADLLGVVASELSAIGRVAKFEGDAVFVCGGDAEVSGEELLAALDAAYLGFARRRRTIALRTTCECDACARIESLDLKFVVHHGEFVEHVVAESREVIGSDVITVHRLLKNTVSERTGLTAFAMLTERCMSAVGLDASRLGLAEHSERYSDIGEIHCWVRDLAERRRRIEEGHRERVEPDECFASASAACPAPRGRVWEVLLDPASQRRWRAGATSVQMASPGGERGVGTTTHCVHGEQAFDQEIVDWRPFDYFTYREDGPYGRYTWTFDLADEPPGTRLRVRVRAEGGIRQRLLLLVGARRFRRILAGNVAAVAARLGDEGTAGKTRTAAEEAEAATAGSPG